MPEEPQQPELQLSLNPDLRGGAFANFATVWHTPYDFTLDFFATEPPARGSDGKPVVPGVHTARVRIPVGVIFALARAISENVSQYEEQFGPIPVPEDGKSAFPPAGSGDEVR